MSRSEFTLNEGTTPFAIDTGWQLFVPPGPPPEGGWPLVLALHGMGMSGRMLALIMNDLLEPRAAYLFPDGVYPYEIRKADRIRIGYAWYLYDGTEPLFRRTLERTEAHLLGLLDAVAAHTPTDRARTFLLGYSQGAYTGYFVALRNHARFAGLVAIAGRMKEEFVAEHLAAASTHLPVLILHGEQDPAVLFDRARATHDTLVRHGFPVEMRSFAKGHELGRPEIEAARAWLGARFGAPPGGAPPHEE